MTAAARSDLSASLPAFLPASLPASRAGIGLYRSLWHFAAGARLALLGGASLLIASQVLRLTMPWLAGQAINVLQLGGTGSIARAGAWVAALLGVCAFAWSLHGPGRILERAVGVHVRRRVAAALFERLAQAPLKWHDRHAASDLQQRMSQASDSLDQFTQNQYVVMQGVITLVGAMVALVAFSPVTGALAITAYAVLVCVGMRFDRSMTVLAREENDAERRYSSGVLEFVSNIVTVTAFRLQPAAKRILGSRLEAIFVPLKRNIRLNEAKWCVVDLLTIGLTWGMVAVYVWRAHGVGGAVLIGGVFMVYKYAEQAGSVVTSAASNLQNFARFRVNFASAEPLWNAPVRPDPGPRLDDEWSTIEVHHVSYRHDDGEAVDVSPAAGAADPGRGIRQASLRLARGERIALVGPSGAGKSTLMRVMAGLYDATHGHVTVDGVSHLGLRPLGTVATFVPQDADVFEMTVAENLAMDAEPSPAALHAALRTSAFDEVLATLPDGLATPIAERGANLSGGQRQRLCLARGLLAAADSSLILLDEPTSALDALTEARVYRELKNHYPTACVIASVHRMSLLEHFDRVVLMADGQIVDTGSVDELRLRQPLFAAMIQGHATPDIQEREAA